MVHLVGNVGFLATLIGLGRLATTDRLGRLAHRQAHHLGLARRIQTVHVLEHIALTASVAVLARPLGLSTLGGMLPPASPTAIGLRVTIHFLLNVVPTTLVLVALWRGRRDRP